MKYPSLAEDPERLRLAREAVEAVSRACSPPPDLPSIRLRIPPGHVYFIQGEAGGPIKIGWAKCVSSRLRYLQCGSPVLLRVLATFDGTRSDEQLMHERFANLRLHGEWFRPEQGLLDLIAERLTAGEASAP